MSSATCYSIKQYVVRSLKECMNSAPFQECSNNKCFCFCFVFFCRISVVVFPFEVVQIQRVTDFIELSHNESLFNEIEHPFFSANHYLSPNEVLD